jgi:dipeptidyl aminopeptidase/acylaminoacyl peptidase
MTHLAFRVLLASALLGAGCSNSDKAGGARPADKAGASAGATLVLSSEPCLTGEQVAAADAEKPNPEGGERFAHAPADPQALKGLRDAAVEGRCRRIRYRSDGLSVVGFVLEPPRAKAAAPLPAVLVARGGNREMGKINPMFLARLNGLAEQGFVIVATQYRGVDGGEGKDEFGGADLADLENLVPIARELPSVDPKNLFVLGYSRGGMMAAMALRRKLPVRAAAFYSGAFDLEHEAASRPEMDRNFREMIPGYDQRPAEELRRRSAVTWADEIGVPALILGGEHDPRAPFDVHGKRLAALLAKAGKEHKLIEYDDDHSLSKHRAETTREIVGWFRAHAAPHG